MSLGYCVSSRGDGPADSDEERASCSVVQVAWFAHVEGEVYTTRVQPCHLLHGSHAGRRVAYNVLLYIFIILYAIRISRYMYALRSIYDEHPGHLG